jgi:hypothetical protein
MTSPKKKRSLNCIKPRWGWPDMAMKPSPEVDAALKSTAGLCHDELSHTLATVGAQVKLLAIVVQTTRGPLALVHGCDCLGCKAAVLAHLGMALGGHVEPDDLAGFNPDAAGAVH